MAAVESEEKYSCPHVKYMRGYGYACLRAESNVVRNKTKLGCQTEGVTEETIRKCAQISSDQTSRRHW